MSNGKVLIPPTNFFLWKLCAWAGPVYCITTVISWAWIGRFLPPPAEYLTAQEVFQFYLDNNMGIRIGMMLTVFFAPLYYIWSNVVSRLMQRAEGPDGVMSNIELLGGFATVIVTFGSCVTWLSASFDTGMKTPQEIKVLNDLGWMWFNPTLMVTVFQMAAFGTAFIVDKRSQPLIPIGMCWFTYAMIATLLVALLTPFFHSGPFAWHGLLTYYVGLGGYFIWILVACYYVFKAIGKLEQEARSDSSY